MQTKWNDKRFIQELSDGSTIDITPIMRAIGSVNDSLLAQNKPTLEFHMREHNDELVRDVSDLIRISQNLFEDGHTDLWFRGHADAEWTLQPEVFRHPYRERAMCSAFMLEAPSRYPTCPPTSDPFACLALMRHYKVPTRLLDWTANVFVATYFAVADLHDRNGSIWVLGPSSLNKASSGKSASFGPFVEEVKKSAHAAIHSDVEGLPFASAVIPQQADLRMLLQHSCFTIHSDSTPLEKTENNKLFLRKYIVRKQEKEFLWKSLSIAGIRRSTLFPDLESLAFDLKSAWQSPE